MNIAINKPPLVNMRYLLIGLLMLVAAGLAFALTPREKTADSGPRIDLERMLPKQFGVWRVDESVVPVQVSADVQAKLNKIYNQTLTRTYVNDQGKRVMLSIAYGGDQSDAMQVHKPEVCYPAQGFQVIKQYQDILDLGSVRIPVKRLVAANGARIEPITYWITVGDVVAMSGWKRKIAQLRYGFTGKIPDGLLFRVSTISRDEEAAFQIQAEFSKSLIASMDSFARQRLIGSGL
jgi:EpsI family protein